MFQLSIGVNFTTIRVGSSFRSTVVLMNSATKTFASLLLVVTLILFALWLFGGKKIKYETRLGIKAPPAVVFPYLTEAEKLKLWISGLSKIAFVNGAQDHVGAVAQVTLREGDRQFQYEDTVLRYEKDKLLSIRSENDVTSTTLVYRLEADGEETQLFYNVKKSRLGIGRLLALFSQDSTPNRVQNDLQNLKQLVEKNYNPTAALDDNGVRRLISQ